MRYDYETIRASSTCFVFCEVGNHRTAGKKSEICCENVYKIIHFCLLVLEEHPIVHCCDFVLKVVEKIRV